MKKIIMFAATLCIGVACAGTALADRWVAPLNGTVSAVMMPDGKVMMKVQIPAKEFEAVTRDMKANAKTCTIQEIYPGETDTMILVCGPAA